MAASSGLRADGDWSNRLAMSPLAETIAFVFGLVGLGYAAGWARLLRPQVGEALTEFAATIAVPTLIFRTMAGLDFHGAAPWALWSTYFLAIPPVWIAAHLVITRGFGREMEAGVVGGVAACFSNMLLIGIPLMVGAYGQPGLEVVALLLSVHLPVMMAASIILFEWARRDKERSLDPLRMLRDFVRNLLSNAIIIGIIAGLLWQVSGLPMPGLMVRFVDAFAGLAVTVALFSMGLSLRRFGISGNVRPAFVLAGLKLIMLPAVALGFALLAPLPPLTAKALVVVAALPTGINPYLIASRFGTGQVLASNTLTISTGLAVLTTAFWLAVVQQVFA